MGEMVVDKPEVKEKVWTYEDYISGRIPPEVSEVLEGKGVRKMPTGGLHGELENLIAFLITSSVRKKYRILVGEIALLLSRSPLNLRGADIVVISKKRLRTPPEGAIDIPPELVIEIVSPYETLPYVIRKIEDYRKWEIKKQVWIFLKDKEVVVITQEGLKNYSADEEVELMEGVKFRLNELLREVEGEKSGG